MARSKLATAPPNFEAEPHAIRQAFKREGEFTSDAEGGGVKIGKPFAQGA